WHYGCLAIRAKGSGVRNQKIFRAISRSCSSAASSRPFA
ncbi:MAG: hypothetical protein AVDCRST_MAG68-3417, partial [uncultured Gemmatimonadetes bacterium]